jgi:hypothetical protein
VVAALLLALILIVFDSPRTTVPLPVTTSTPVVPATTAMSTPSATTALPAKQPPGHKPGKPGRSGNGDEGD